MSSKHQERRIFSTGEIRASESGSKRMLRGYASVKNIVTLIGGARGGFHEVVRGNNVFGDALKKSDVRFLTEHDPRNLLARQSAGTLRLSEDARGLRYEVDLPNTQLAKDTFELVRTGALRDCSYAFSVGVGDDSFADYDCEDRECCGQEGHVLRTISRVDKLYDASLVVFPAFSGTSVAGYAVEDLSADPTDGDDDDENGDGEGGRSLVRVSVEARSRAAACRKPRMSDSEWLAAAQRKLAEIDGAWMANAQRRLSQAEQAIRVSDTVGDLGLESQAARDLAFSEDVRITKRNARYLRHPHTLEGTGTQYLEWLDAFLKG